ncbi:hypothetical protein [Gordonibacter massiliensis (ex Traore et al. 2017)]|uniref:Uncharacterized protein n=1 Tax=Gordonibacter massiliensis (ex Traore et al. 2017) TaxID=1841863 RepID=A0A842JIE8_9ACTN|nr:hypothetical protein [Gordonibacter massiliensis (ex Traore et al. 2017)]MBC2889618.1 hypothetical protein [Gordonibacter massiliensis (ex Traore et al. 2017)]MBX9033172.1 hypothetical protein [Gordonibacter massiliensis (ex Traore et al. 2017)]
MFDPDQWELQSVPSCSCLYALVPKGAGRTFLQRFAEKRQNREAALCLFKALRRIDRDGIGRSLAIGLIRRLRGPVVEVKVFGTVIRGIAYQKSGQNALVLLSVEKTHQGSGNMHALIDEAERKAALVEALLAAREEG